MNDSEQNLVVEVARLSSIVAQMQMRLQKFENSSQYTFAKDIQIMDGNMIILGGNQGTKIGKSTSKIGFYGVAPVARQASISAPSGGGTVDSQARTAINTIISRLSTSGLTA